ncbi:hypothetical protein evm_015123 [Chilo suppressalis]|nr:hypothetical protein evm_015123 [Chilo suppressalis]
MEPDADSCHKPDLTSALPTRPRSGYDKDGYFEAKVPTMASLSGSGVVTHTAPSYEEQRASPALLSRGAGGTPGGRSVRDDGGWVVIRTAPSYEEQRASPALLSRGAGGRNVFDDEYCSAGSMTRAQEILSTGFTQWWSSDSYGTIAPGAARQPGATELLCGRHAGQTQPA